MKKENGDVDFENKLKRKREKKIEEKNEKNYLNEKIGVEESLGVDVENKKKRKKDDEILKL
jgi:hypothetical protein